jgi:hypothetical protein
MGVVRTEGLGAGEAAVNEDREFVTHEFLRSTHRQNQCQKLAASFEMCCAGQSLKKTKK